MGRAVRSLHVEVRDMDSTRLAIEPHDLNIHRPSTHRNVHDAVGPAINQGRGEYLIEGHHYTRIAKPEKLIAQPLAKSPPMVEVMPPVAACLRITQVVALEASRPMY